MDEKDYKAMNEESKPQLKQTAVDWLVEELTCTTWKYVPFEERMKIFRKAKQIEKKQMQDIFNDGSKSTIEHYITTKKFYDGKSLSFEEYYNKTYGNEDKSSE